MNPLRYAMLSALLSPLVDDETEDPCESAGAAPQALDDSGEDFPG
jgi:hypothetical protein